jgi:hypothetical protein
MNLKLMYSRQALSAAAWRKARWRDGRRVVLAPLPTDMAMQGATCRVMPATDRWAGRWPNERRVSPEAHEEAITMTWDEAAVVLMRPIAMFGIDLTGD